MQAVHVERIVDTYVARGSTGDVLWSVDLHLDLCGTTFRDQIAWWAADVVAVAGGPMVYFLAAGTGALVTTLALDGDLFGHFGPADHDVLYILGWQHVVAVDRGLTVRWVSREVAVDGITWRGCDGDRLQLSAEMDPPGGWVDVELDAATGRELARGRCALTGL